MEYYYTLEQAREILKQEALEKQMAKEKRDKERKAKRKEKFLYFLKQKLIGVVLVIIAIASPIMLDGDATASLFILPMGLYTIFTKERVII